MKYPIEKMRKCLALLPPPGGEVVAECLDEIELLRQQVMLLRDALTKLLAVSGCSLVYHLADTPEQRQAKEALASTDP